MAVVVRKMDNNSKPIIHTYKYGNGFVLTGKVFSLVDSQEEFNHLFTTLAESGKLDFFTECHHESYHDLLLNTLSYCKKY